ncbi:MAG: TolC family protein [Acidobacteriota bacterium]|nr:TolC family protein [Acidobacteriota bacterium]
MKIRSALLRAVIPVLLISWLVPVMAAQESAPEEISLGLEEAIFRALKQNLNLVAEVYSTERASQSVSLAKEIYYPQLDFKYGTDRTEQPSTWWIQSAGLYTTKMHSYQGALSQRIPLGGKLSLSLYNYDYDTNQRGQLLNPYYQTELRIDFEQPLLKNFGPKIAEKEIVIARQNYSISEAQLRSQVLDTIYQVEDAYWNLVLAQENLKVRQQSLQLARDELAKTSKEIEVGKQASIEILNVQATVSQREADIVQAEADVRIAENRLKVILNLAPGTELQSIKINPKDKPEFKPVQISLEEAGQIALANRPDLQVNNLTIDKNRFNLEVARNQLLPQLDLNFSYRSPGISGDLLLYQDDNPFSGVIIGKIPGSTWNSFKDAMKFLYNNWSLNFTLTIPIADLASRSNYAIAQTELAQALAKQKASEQQALLEVSEAVNNIATYAKSVEAYRVAREFAEKNLEAEMKKLAVGLSSNYFVLEAQDKLANARSNELRAMVNYNLALSNLEKVLGTSLVNRNINLTAVGQK